MYLKAAVVQDKALLLQQWRSLSWVSRLLILDCAPTCIASDFGLLTYMYLGSQLRVLDFGTGELEIEDNQASLDENYIQGLQRP